MQIAATPAVGSYFTNFTGDVKSSVNPLNVVVQGKPLNIKANFAATVLTLSQSALFFGASPDGSLVTSPQTVTVLAPPTVTWTVSFNQNFLTVSPSSSTGNGSFMVSVVGSKLPGSGAPTGMVSVTASGVTNSPQTVNVTVNINPTSNLHGSFDTPADGTTGVAGSLAVTGWALDNVEVTRVDIWREKIGSEAVAANGLVYIGDAVFVAGARPDVQNANPGVPFNDRGGWGYLMLTNELPNNGGSAGLGNGVYRLHAIAHNAAGQNADLGTKAITADNAHAQRPFGTIDTPNQGGTISGAQFVNFGWALTQNPYAIPLDGSTITVAVDGVTLGSPVYNQNLTDIANLFPGLANSLGAIGYYFIDTTQFTNGVHTIYWLVQDDHGRGDGVGSRFFNILNTTTGSVAPPEDAIAVPGAVTLRRGYDKNRAIETLTGAGDLYSIDIQELDRIELQLGARSGYSMVNGVERPLPAGSSLEGGVFYWHLAPVFSGVYQLAFDRDDGSRVRVRVSVGAKKYSPVAR